MNIIKKKKIIKNFILLYKNLFLQKIIKYFQCKKIIIQFIFIK